MKAKMGLTLLFMAFLAVFGPTACLNEDEPKDRTKEVTMYVSSETGTRYDFGACPTECMLVRERGDDAYHPMSFGAIEGFEYEKGCRYVLRVRKTTLANPPADGGRYRFGSCGLWSKAGPTARTQRNRLVHRAG